MSWEETKKCDKCSYIENLDLEISMDKSVIEKIVALMENEEKEWLGFLIGKAVGKEGEYMIITINDIEIPKQNVTVASAEPDEQSMKKIIKKYGKNIVGLIHSHNSMSSFLSGTDIEHSFNHGFISIVVNKELDVVVGLKYELPCGMIYIGEILRCKLFELLDIMPDMSWYNKVKKRINKETIKSLFDEPAERINKIIDFFSNRLSFKGRFWK